MHGLRRALTLGMVAFVAVAGFPAGAQGTGKGTVLIDKTDGQGGALPGATIRLLGRDGTFTCITDAAGGCEMTVPAGSYKLLEDLEGYSGVSISNIKISAGEKLSIALTNSPSPVNERVNDPTGDSNVGDGTHLTQMGPSIQVGTEESPNVFIAFNDPAGLSSFRRSATGFARSSDGGLTFEDLGQVPAGGPNNNIFGDPSLVRLPPNDLFVANVFCRPAVTGGRICPIAVSRSTNGGQTWGDPVATWPNIGSDPVFAHSPSLTADTNTQSPFFGNLYLTFTRSTPPGEGIVFFTASMDEGATWTEPIRLSEGSSSDFPGVAVDPVGGVHAQWGDYRSGDSWAGYGSVSPDGGQTFESPRPIFTDIPRSGEPGDCGTGQDDTRVYEGSIFAQDRMLQEWRSLKRGVAVFTRHGAGTDLSDVVFARTTDGGRTWSPPKIVGLPSGTQFFPVLDLSQTGVPGIVYFGTGTSETPVELNVYSFIPRLRDFNANRSAPLEGETLRVSTQGFQIHQINPNFDSFVNDCRGVEPPGFVGPGSGGFIAWGDGRDAGPQANKGIDPNIYFAQTQDFVRSGAIALSIAKGANSITPSGIVAPLPLNGTVKLTLATKTGGGFQNVAIQKDQMDKANQFEGRFPRPNARTCRVTALYPGDANHPPQSANQTFAC